MYSTVPIKVLAISDEVVSLLYSPKIKDLYGDVDLVVGCGDLPYYYLEYITTLLPADVLYVYGNHDKTQFMSDGRQVNAAEGCVLLEDQIVERNGLLFAGLGGSMRYQPRAVNQYTEGDMRTRILKMTPQLLYNKAVHGRFLDVLVTHSPAFGIHDGPDLPHTGFKSLLWFMDTFKPRYMLHGHMHVYRPDQAIETRYNETTIINVYPRMDLEIEIPDEIDQSSPEQSEEPHPD